MMATATESSSELLKCSICFEVFKTPKYLPCLHTFCEPCLGTYITSLFEKQQNLTGFNCPVCRLYVPGPENKKTEEWANTFPVNHLIVSLIDHQVQQMGKSCDSCLRENVEEKADSFCVECSEVLCTMCVKFHRKNKYTIVHQIMKLDELSKEYLVALPSPKLFCEEHSGKKMELFCVDHDTPCCLVCMTLHHRKCDRIMTMEEASKDIRDIKIPKLSKQIDKTCKTLNDIAKAKQMNIDRFDHQCDSIRKKMTSAKQEILDRCSELESAKEKELDKLYELNMSELKIAQENCQTQSSMLMNCRKCLQACANRGADSQLVDEYNKLKTRHQEITTSLKSDKSLGKSIEVSVEFKVDSNVMECLSRLKSFGKITVTKSQTDTDKSKIDFQKAKPVLKHSFNPKNKARYLGCDFMSCDKIILGDLDSSTCFTCDISGSNIKEVQLSGNIFDIAVIDDNTAIASLHSKYMLQFIDINNMKPGTEHSVGASCYGVDVYKNELFVALRDIIKVYDLNAQEIRTIALSNSCDSRLIVVKQGYIYYTNRYTKSVQCIDMSGVELFLYNDVNLNYPLGLSVDCQGNVYIAGNYSHNVHQISPQGKQIKLLLQSQKPYGLEFDSNSNKFLLTTDGGRKIEIYEMV